MRHNQYLALATESGPSRLAGKTDVPYNDGERQRLRTSENGGHCAALDVVCWIL
jgi:hypothetical protein